MFDGSNDYIDVDMTVGPIVTISLRAKANAATMADMLRVLGDNNHGPDLYFGNNNIYLNTRDGYTNPLCAMPSNVTGRHYYTTTIAV